MTGNLLLNLLKSKIHSTDKRHFEVEAEIPGLDGFVVLSYTEQAFCNLLHMGISVMRRILFKV